MPPLGDSYLRFWFAFIEPQLRNIGVGRSDLGGLLVPSARSASTNLVVFAANCAGGARFEIGNAEPIA